MGKEQAFWSISSKKGRHKTVLRECSLRSNVSYFFTQAALILQYRLLCVTKGALEELSPSHGTVPWVGVYNPI